MIYKQTIREHQKTCMKSWDNLLLSCLPPHQNITIRLMPFVKYHKNRQKLCRFHPFTNVAPPNSTRVVIITFISVKIITPHHYYTAPSVSFNPFYEASFTSSSLWLWAVVVVEYLLLIWYIRAFITLLLHFLFN